MGFSLLRGVAATQALPAGHLAISDPEAARRRAAEEQCGAKVFTDNRELVAFAEFVVLAVKPQALDAVLEEIASAVTADKTVLSIAAGVPTYTLESRLPAGTRVVRAMPNAPAVVGAAATAVAPGANANESDLDFARALFESVGLAVVTEEHLLDAVTGLSGSGPAYVMVVVEALADGGVKVGLSRKVALELATQTVYGSAKLLKETRQHPAMIKDMVASPGGTTIDGLYALEAGGLRHALINAVERAARRAGVLGEELARRLRAKS
jgi:pyrroline-5-carboxylate reductase